MNAVQRVVAAVAKLVGYGDVDVEKASRGAIGDYLLGQDPRYGQPRLSRGDMQSGGTYITNSRMREIALKSDTVAAIVNAIVDYVTSVPLRAVPIDHSQEPPKNKTARIMRQLRKPNPQTNGQEFLRALVRDIAVLGYGAVEVVHGPGGLELWNLDATKLSIDFDEHGTILGYDQLNAEGVPIRGEDGMHAWEPEDVILFRHDAVTWSVYPMSRVEQLYTAAIVESLMLNFVGQKYVDSNIPFGVFDLGDLTDQELQDAIDRWDTQADSPHRLVLTGSKGGAKFISFHDDLQRLEAPALLTEVRTRIMSVFGATTNELAFVMREGSGSDNLSYTFKKRCVEPFLATITAALSTRLIAEVLGFADLELVHEEIDSKDEQTEAQISEILLKMGVMTINELRSTKQLPKVDGGDSPYLYTPTGAIPVSLLEDMAKAQLQAVQAAARQAVASAKSTELANKGAQAGMNPDGTPKQHPDVLAPSPRAARPPDQTGSPDASRGGGTSVRLPHPDQSIKPAKPGGVTGVKAPGNASVAHAGAAGEKKSDDSEEQNGPDCGA